MSICEHCGKVSSDSANYCEACGHKLTKEKSAASAKKNSEIDYGSMAYIRVQRPKACAGMFVNIYVYLDDVNIAQLSNEEEKIFRVAPGKRILSFEMTEYKKKVSFDLNLIANKIIDCTCWPSANIFWMDSLESVSPSDPLDPDDDVIAIANTPENEISIMLQRYFAATTLCQDILFTENFIIGFKQTTKEFFICTIDREKAKANNFRVYNCSNIVSVEFNPLTKMSTIKKSDSSLPGALIGYSIAGPLGLLIGSNATTNYIQSEEIEGFELKIQLDNFSEPLIEIYFSKEEQLDAEKWHGIFSTLKYLQSKR
jgi:hypothetical protein